MAQNTVIILDSLRKQRDVADYESDPISDQVVIERLKRAEGLLQTLLRWIELNRPDVLQ